MKKLIISVLIPLTTTLVFGVESDLVSLDSYISNHDTKDKVVVTYTMERCTALYLYFASQSQSETSQEGIKFHQNAQNGYKKLTYLRTNFVVDNYKNPEGVIKEGTETIKRMTSLYKSRADKVLDSGRDLNEDKLIWSGNPPIFNLS